MRGSSTTAEYMALFRALETARGSNGLFQDRFAQRFLAPRFRLLAALAQVPEFARVLTWYIDRGWPGTRSSAVVRTKMIDDAVTAGLSSGIRQLVLLGAGLDSRGLRLPGVARSRVFEVDHPATQATKRARLVALGLRNEVTFVPIDLATGSLEDALVAAGFTAVDRSIVLWEGVTNYLTAAAVDGTLAALARLMCEESLLVMTYVLPELVRDMPSSKEAVRWARRVQRVGERFTFGSEPAAMAERLATFGFETTSDESTAEAALRLVERGARAEAGSLFYRVLLARRRCRV